MTDAASRPRAVLQWYDYICPFCYVGQQRTAILVQHGVPVEVMPFQTRPDVPTAGLEIRFRSGPMYTALSQKAKEAGLRLNWPSHLPNSRRALANAEWVRRFHPEAFATFHKSLFEAHFVLGENLGDQTVIDRHASESGIDLVALHTGLGDGTAGAAVRESENLGRQSGVQGTPAWLFAEQLVTTLLPVEDFERLAEDALQIRP